MNRCYRNNGRRVSSLLAKRWMRQGKTAIVAGSSLSACDNLTIRSQQSALMNDVLIR